MTREGRLIRTLTITNTITCVLLLVLLLGGFARPARTRLDELDVQRLNVVDAEGRPMLVLSNRQRIPGGKMNGKSYPPMDGREQFAGMLFYNQDGDEVGGLVFSGSKMKSGTGGDYAAVGHLSFDQWKQNQVVALQYNDHGNTRRAGLYVWDRPTSPSLDVLFDRAQRLKAAAGEERETLKKETAASRDRGDFGAQRIFVGSQDQKAQVQLSDTKGRPRARLSVGPDDVAHLDFLDRDGKVVATYPPPPPGQ
jgi:hypothetical protein